MEVIKLNNSNFKSEAKETDKVVLIDFYADWCGPCKMMSPIIDNIAEEADGGVKVCKLNVDEAPEIASEYGVMSIPTLVILKNGTVINTLIGLQDKQTVLDALKIN